MEIIVEKYTNVGLMRKACMKTMHKKRSNASLASIYKCEHSPARTQMFWIEMNDIPTFVSVHFVRHKFGVEHFVTSNRDDRGGDQNVDRNTPVDHGMWLNAQELIFMARKRLCMCAHVKTVEVMRMIVDGVRKVDPELADRMVPECIYRGFCPEMRSCGYSKTEDANHILDKYRN
jgi:hypothetical protein